MTERKHPKDWLYCSFCGKSEEEVRKLIAGPAIFICDECVGLCVAFLRDAGIEPGSPEERRWPDRQKS